MSFDFVTIVGLCAGTMTTISFVPQVLKTWRTRSSGDLSAGMFGLFSMGLVLWLIYGGAIGSLPIVLANAVTLALTLAVLFLKFKFRIKK